MSLNHSKKFSVITVSRNAETTILDAINSVNSQTIRTQIEHIFIDGLSYDETPKIINSHKQLWDKSYALEPRGIYNAMNFGLQQCTGEYITFLNADDYYASDTVFQDLLEFTEQDNNFIFSSVKYIDSVMTKRIWSVGLNTDSDLAQLPHPGVCAKLTFIRNNKLFFREHYNIAADYDQQIRAKRCKGFKGVYRNEIVVNMRVGGHSNRDIRNVIRGIYETFIILRKEVSLFSAITYTFQKICLSLHQRLKRNS